MKLVLIALAIEISLARVFASSLLWAAAFVVLYCTLVYVFMSCKVLLSGKQNTFNMRSESTTWEGCVKGNSTSETQLYNLAEV